MHLRVIIEYDKEVDAFSAVCPELPGCASCGDIEEEVMENIKEAIELYLEPDSLEERNKHAKYLDHQTLFK